ncbi:hypothetical protein ACTG9Q_15200 [Actinokineospora sp. 24-640]
MDDPAVGRFVLSGFALPGLATADPGTAERPAALWPCLNDSDRGLRIAFYATTYDGIPGSDYDFYLGKNCNVDVNGEFNVRIRHWGFPNVVDKVIYISPREVIQIGFKPASQTQQHPNAFTRSQGLPSRAASTSPDHPLPPPPMEFTGPFPLDPVPPCPSWCPRPRGVGRRPSPPPATVAVERHRGSEDTVPLAGAEFDLMYLDADAGCSPCGPARGTPGRR